MASTGSSEPGGEVAWLQTLSMCGMKVAMPASPRLSGPRLGGTARGKWPVGMAPRIHLSLDFSPSVGSSFGLEVLIPSQQRRQCQRLQSQSLQPRGTWLQRELPASSLALRGRRVCSAGHQSGYFGHCQAPARSQPPPEPAPQALEAAWAPISCLGK